MGSNDQKVEPPYFLFFLNLVQIFEILIIVTLISLYLILENSHSYRQLDGFLSSNIDELNIVR